MGMYLQLTLKRLGGVWRPPPCSFFCPSTLVFDTIIVKLCDFYCLKFKGFFIKNFFLMHGIGYKAEKSPVFEKQI